MCRCHQFACDLLEPGQPERAHWKACEQTTDEEAATAELFKQAFGTFDPALA